MSSRRVAVIGIAAALLVLPAAVQGHIERPGYWPDPALDCSIDPCAGGHVPHARSLASALDPGAVGDTRVVCKPDSLNLLEKSIGHARAHGYDNRPHDRRSLSAGQAVRLLHINRELFNLCSYRNIQPAVADSGNNDRVVVMPGLYTEPESRAKPTSDPACDKYEQSSDRGTPGAVSYAYQFHCPNDQNLIAVIGRRPGHKAAPYPARWNRRGIPDLGPCIRCNLQIEGSGVSADDVVVDAGDPAAGDGGPSGVGSAKDVGIRADRADGFVLRKMTFRHAAEHGIYLLESDGYLLDRFKAFYNGLYGVLTFVEDHGLMQNCEAVGHGDSGLYPGAAADTGEQRAPGTRFRYGQEIRRCDMHHNLSGYSGTDGNAVHVDHNNFYNNTLGLTTDVATGAGHPGFPQDSDLIDHNNFYSNNFNPYVRETGIVPASPFPVGTGMWIAGGNNNVVRHNHFWNNWRRGVMLFAVPDAFVCGPLNGGNQQSGCNALRTSTSHRNSFYGNVLGITPGGEREPNGLDFWWDAFPGNRGNCWYENTDPRGVSSSPPGPLLPDCADGSSPGSSIGIGNVPAEAEILSCIPAFETYNFNGPEASICPWFRSPSRPTASKTESGAPPRLLRSFLNLCAQAGSSPFCQPFAGLRDAQRAPSEVPLQLFNCSDWERADQAMRAHVIGDLRVLLGGQVTGQGVSGTGATLPDDGAYRLFENYCGKPLARGFLLYKLYGRTAGFAGLAG